MAKRILYQVRGRLCLVTHPVKKHFCWGFVAKVFAAHPSFSRRKHPRQVNAGVFDSVKVADRFSISTDAHNLGSVKPTFEPWPTSDSRKTCPPCRSTTSRTKERPRPVDSSPLIRPSRATR